MCLVITSGLETRSYCVILSPYSQRPGYIASFYHFGAINQVILRPIITRKYYILLSPQSQKPGHIKSYYTFRPPNNVLYILRLVYHIRARDQDILRLVITSEIETRTYHALMSCQSQRPKGHIVQYNDFHSDVRQQDALNSSALKSISHFWSNHVRMEIKLTSSINHIIHPIKTPINCKE